MKYKFNYRKGCFYSSVIKEIYRKQLLIASFLTVQLIVGLTYQTSAQSLEPDWSEFYNDYSNPRPSLFGDGGIFGRRAYERESSQYWSARKKVFDNELAICKATENTDSRNICYLRIRETEANKNKEWVGHINDRRTKNGQAYVDALNPSKLRTHCNYDATSSDCKSWW